jgi:hypothetical protein
MTEPVALKARFVAFCTPELHVEPCGAPILGGTVQPTRPGSLTARSLTARQRKVVELLAEGRSMKEAAILLPRTVDCHTARNPLLCCSLPRGHKGPHRA